MAIHGLPIAGLCGFSLTGDLGGFTFYRSRRGKIVWYPQAPPLNPASLAQVMQRNHWRMAAAAWQALSPAARASWELATQKLHLMLTGYNLFVYWQTRGDAPTIQTIERQSGVNLGV